MKFVKKFLLLIVGVLVLLSPAVASAAPGVSISTSADPQTVYRKDLAEPDESTITVRLDGSGTVGTEHAPVDVVLVIDASGSMGSGVGSPLAAEQTAAKSFIDQMDANTDQVGLVSFDDTATLDSQLSTNFAAVKTAVDNVSGGFNTNYQDAMIVSQGEITSVRHHGDAASVAIFMSDGEPTTCNNWPACSIPNDTKTAIDNAKAAGITFYTIGLNVFDPSVLQYMAGTTDHYFEAPTSDDLAAIYAQIATLLIQTAGQDTAIELKLDPNLELVPDSWSITPTSSNGGLYGFDVGTLNLGDSWTVTFRVTFPHASLHDIFDVNGSRYTYTNYLGVSADYAVPQVQVNVLDRTPDAGDWTIVFLGIVAMLLTFQIYRFTKIIKARHN